MCLFFPVDVIWAYRCCIILLSFEFRDFNTDIVIHDRQDFPVKSIETMANMYRTGFHLTE
jgi:hypothetical protein